jgi:hypothetical protein
MLFAVRAAEEDDCKSSILGAALDEAKPGIGVSRG